MKRVIQLLSIALLFLLLFEASRLYFIGYNAALFEGSLPRVFFQSVLYGLRLDLSATAYCMFPLLLVFIGEHIAGRKSPPLLMRVIVLSEVILAALIAVADPELFQQWGSKFNNQVLVYISHPKEMAISTGSVHWGKTMLFAAVFSIFCFFLIRAMFRVLNQTHTYSRRQIALLLLLAGLNFVMLRGGTGVATISQASAIHSSDRVHNAAAVNSLWNALYYILNDTRTLYGSSHRVMDEAVADSLMQAQLGKDSMPFRLTREKKPNVLIVMLESFTASGSRFFSGYNDCMPYLDRIASENLSFTQCYSSGDRTEKGLVSINSAYPAQPVSTIIVFPDKVMKLPGLSRELKKQSYTNTFVYGGDAEFASMKSYLLMQDFDRITDKRDFHAKDLNSKWGAHDANFYDRVLQQANASQEPFYTLALSLSSHEPFDVPYESADLPRDEWYGFKNSLRYADKCLYDFLEACRKSPWYKNTLIVLVADHGHDIGLKDKHYFGKEKYHIPLVFTGGALSPELKGMKIDRVVSQTIIPSMLLASMNLPYRDFIWQSGFYSESGFAQYHYNNGFGRVGKRSACVFDNAGASYFFQGDESERDRMKMMGKVFQQVLIDDFLKK